MGFTALSGVQKLFCTLEWSSRKQNRPLYLSLLSQSATTKFENTIFHKAKLRFWTIKKRLMIFQNDSQGKSLNAGDLICSIQGIYIHILTPIKAELAKFIKTANFFCLPKGKSWEKIFLSSSHNFVSISLLH